ncbi:uncharacterized protein LOC123710454 isoform X1 [Pieris brassicae]|uniref:uncharacterized protein LOC123710454 isoform X1 n=2 Tax=Pieris brassicae TaxID=7116 RepID=UPI001E65F273|nr:uncharacterized protein LOC123710454 isoform X1 [Pieris brassicae]
MSPRKQPSSLFKLCVRTSLNLINECCFIIEKNYADIECKESEKQIILLKGYLVSLLPTRLFDVLCLERGCYRYRGDPRIQLNVLIHPSMSIFRKSDLDNGIPQTFWVHVMPRFTHLVVLDLKFICTDEILELIGSKCLLLEELNIVSRVDICKSLINASVLIRNVSDSGLSYISNLKNLRILAMDPPRNERASRVGRCVSQAGIIMLISELPYLEELRIESCDIGSTLINTDVSIGPLSLRKINCHFASAEGMRKLVKICPHLKELSITHLSANNKDAILEEIALSDLRLSKLDMSFFSHSDSLHHLLEVKGSYLTHFSLWEIDHSLSLDEVINLGTSCPNLTSLCLITQSNYLSIPRFFRQPKNIFRQLEVLTLGNERFSIEDILVFFLECTLCLRKLTLKFQTKLSIDNTLIYILQKGYFKNVRSLWLDCTLEVSKDVVKQVIQGCEMLQLFTVDFTEDMSDVHKYIADNNLDLKLGGY